MGRRRATRHAICDPQALTNILTVSLVLDTALPDLVVPPEIEALQVHPGRPLLLVDVDEVLAMFMHGFERFLGARGLEMRIDRFALFQNIFKPGESEHLDVSAGRVLFDEFFM